MARKNCVKSTSMIDKKLSYQFELISVCFHEAGHTISGLLNFFLISEVGVELTKDKRSNKDLGYTHFEAVFDLDLVKNESLANKLLISEININYAGLAAEKIFYKDICGTDQLPMVLKSGSYIDRNKVAELIKKYNLALPGKKRHLFKKKIFNETRKSLELYWSDVKLISHSLFNKRKLYYDDLKQILIKKSKNRVFWKKHIKNIETIFEAALINDEKFIYNIILN